MFNIQNRAAGLDFSERQAAEVVFGYRGQRCSDRVWVFDAGGVGWGTSSLTYAGVGFWAQNTKTEPWGLDFGRADTSTMSI